MPVPQPEAVLQRSDRLSWRVLEGDAVILHPEAGTLHRLNGTGTRLWELMDGARDLAAIAQLLTDEYEVDLPTATEEVVAVAGDLVDAGLVDVKA